MYCSAQIHIAALEYACLQKEKRVIMVFSLSRTGKIRTNTVLSFQTQKTMRP